MLESDRAMIDLHPRSASCFFAKDLFSGPSILFAYKSIPFKQTEEKSAYSTAAKEHVSAHFGNLIGGLQNSNGKVQHQYYLLVAFIDFFTSKTIYIDLKDPQIPSDFRQATFQPHGSCLSLLRQEALGCWRKAKLSRLSSLSWLRRLLLLRWDWKLNSTGWIQIEDTWWVCLPTSFFDYSNKSS